MKTRLFFFSLMIIASIGHGQTIFLKFGPSFSRLAYSNSQTTKISIDQFIIGYDAIVGFNYLKFKYFNLSSGIGLIQKGGNIDFGVPNGDAGYHYTKTTTKLNFLTINTTFNLKIPITKFIEPYIVVGPRLDYLFSYNENRDFIKVFDDNKKLNKVIYGILFGGGINFNIKRFELGLALDYYFNINKLVNYKGVSSLKYYEDTYIINDNTFTLNALIGFKF